MTRIAEVLGIAMAHSDDPFVISGEASIMEEDHLGIVNGRLTAGIQYKDVATVDGLWAPPFVSSDFRLGLTVLGQPVPTRSYQWQLFQVDRDGTVADLRANTVTAQIPGHRAGLLRITVENQGQ